MVGTSRCGCPRPYGGRNGFARRPALPRLLRRKPARTAQRAVPTKRSRKIGRDIALRCPPRPYGGRNETPKSSCKRAWLYHVRFRRLTLRSATGTAQRARPYQRKKEPLRRAAPVKNKNKQTPRDYAFLRRNITSEARPPKPANAKVAGSGIGATGVTLNPFACPRASPT